MLVYSIKKKLGVVAAMQNLTDKWRANAPSSRFEHGEMECPWPKHQFINWMDSVCHQFKVGDVVAWSAIKPTPNNLPFLFTVSYINELYKDVPFSVRYREPRIIHMTNMHGQTLKACPIELRKLTLEEKELADLQNTKAQGSA